MHFIGRHAHMHDFIWLKFFVQSFNKANLILFFWSDLIWLLLIWFFEHWNYGGKLFSFWLSDMWSTLKWNPQKCSRGINGDSSGNEVYICKIVLRHFPALYILVPTFSISWCLLTGLYALTRRPDNMNFADFILVKYNLCTVQ